MADPYTPPESENQPIIKKRPNYNKAPVIGCLTGGCFIPTVALFGSTLILGDMGEPIFFPGMVISLGLTGLAIGLCLKKRGQQSRRH